METFNVRPAKMVGIAYKAYSRSVPELNAQVIILVASCWFAESGYEVFFRRDGEAWKLMEWIPAVANRIVTYYSTSTATPVTTEMPLHVMVEDGYGKHTVPVMPWMETGTGN